MTQSPATHHASRITIQASRSALLAATVFVFAAALYIRTTCPTLGGGFDSEEFQHVAYTLGIAHSTGYPFYLLLGKIITTLVPIGNVAYRMNLLSALIGAATVALVYLNALMLTRRQIASLAAAALFATNPAVWRQSGIASVGPLHLFFIAAILYAALLWLERRAAFGLVAFLFGLGLTHHRTTFLFAPAIFLVLLLVRPTILRQPSKLARAALWVALPLLFYLYVPIFGGNSPWYNNTLQGFFSHISGEDAGAFMRTTPFEMAEGIVIVSRHLLDSFGYLGGALIALGAIRPLWHLLNKTRTDQSSVPAILFLGTATLPFAWLGTFYAGEPDRYLALPFVFLIYWFALGAGTIEERMEAEREMARKPLSFILHPSSFAILLALLIVLPFGDRFRISDWSSFDRVYKQWDEIFTLPIPRRAILVGNWGQLNAMRYMQSVENRRPDLQFIGTLYDPAPQTDAALDAFAEGRALFLSPGIALPVGTYRYALLGPLLEVRGAPQMQPPKIAQDLAIAPSLTLAGYEITTALEPYAPTQRIAPNRTARVTLHWRAEGSVKDFLVRIRLYDPEARLVAQKDEAPVRGLYPASQWQRGEYISDVHNFLIPAGTPPGVYQLKMQTLDAQTQRETSNEIALGSFGITRATNLTREQVFIAHPLDLALDPRIALWGYGGLDSARRAGETITFNLIWRARENIGEDLPARFALVDASGKTMKEWQRAPIAFYSTREWQRGEVLKAYYDLPLANDLLAGKYTLSLGFDSLHNIAQIEITP